MRLIDADALKKEMFGYYDCVNEHSAKHNYSGDTLMDYEVSDLIDDCIEYAPTIDAVPVVRCGECEHLRTEAAITIVKNNKSVRICPCDKMGRAMHDDDFCSYGERRSDG